MTIVPHMDIFCEFCLCTFRISDTILIANIFKRLVDIYFSDEIVLHNVIEKMFLNYYLNVIMFLELILLINHLLPEFLLMGNFSLLQWY